MTSLLASSIETYLPLVILIVVAVVFGATNLLVTQVAMWFLKTRRNGAVKELTYETGMDPIGTARKRFNIRFYVLAITFLVFDVEVVFLFPWSTVFATLAETTEADQALRFQFFARILFFVGTSVIAYLYAFRKGVFRYD